MARGKHRVPTPVRLVAAAAAVLTIGGIVVATGTASAENAGTSTRTAGRGDPTAACRTNQAISLGAMVTKLRDGRLKGGRLAALALAQRGDGGQGRDGQGGDGRGDRGSRDGDGGQGRGGQERQDGGGRGGDGGGDQGQDCGDDQGQGQGQGQDRGGDNQGREDGDQDQGNGDQDQGNGADEQFPGRDQAGGPSQDDFVDIQQVSPNAQEPEAGSEGSTGSFTSVCGTNAEGHRNSDNYMQAPGKVNAAQHVHEYVGNVSTDAFSDDDNLADEGTTCAKGDASAYFWPALRDTDGQGDDAEEDGGGLDGNVGEILEPIAVGLEFRGNPAGRVEQMPQFLRLIVGDAKAATKGDDADVQSQWTCTGFEDRTTTKYPLCPRGTDLMRILDFPSCWDGENLDSEDHKSHIVFPEKDGSCSGDTVAVPQLHMTLTYQRPNGTAFALDSFPDQQHNPRTDHGQFENLMPEKLMNTAVDCINNGQTC